MSTFTTLRRIFISPNRIQGCQLQILV